MAFVPRCRSSTKTDHTGILVPLLVAVSSSSDDSSSGSSFSSASTKAAPPRQTTAYPNFTTQAVNGGQMIQSTVAGQLTSNINATNKILELARALYERQNLSSLSSPSRQTGMTAAFPLVAMQPMQSVQQPMQTVQHMNPGIPPNARILPIQQAVTDGTGRFISDNPSRLLGQQYLQPMAVAQPPPQQILLMAPATSPVESNASHHEFLSALQALQARDTVRLWEEKEKGARRALDVFFTTLEHGNTDPYFVAHLRGALQSAQNMCN